MDEGDPCEAEGGDLCEADDGKLATARSRMPQLPPHFSEASRVHSSSFCIPAKDEKTQPSSAKLVVLLRWMEVTFEWRTAVS